MAVGMINGFGGPWLESRGLDAFQIGIINALPIAFMVLLTVPIGRLADKARDWRDVIQIGMVLNAAILFGLFWATGFYGILFVWTIGVLSQSLTIPVSDGAALRYGRRNGGNLGSFRALSTIGYLLVILAAGPALSQWGFAIFLPLLVGFSVMRALCALALPRLRAAEDEVTAKPPFPLSALRRRWFLLPCLGAAILLATTLVLNGFQSVLWLRQGLSPTQIGILIALGAGAEAALFFAYGWITRFVSPVTLLLIAAVASALRYVLLGLELPFAALLLVQLMHALTFGVAFLASANFIADNTGEEIAASAQAVLTMTFQVIGVLLLLSFGWLANQAGLAAYFALAGVASLAVVLIALAGKAPLSQNSQKSG